MNNGPNTMTRFLVQQDRDVGQLEHSRHQMRNEKKSTRNDFDNQKYWNYHGSN